MKMYGSYKAVEGTTFLSILFGDGSGREHVLFFIQKMWSSEEQTLNLYYTLLY